MTSPELIDWSAGEAVAAIARGDVTAERYAAALLAQCEAGKHLNAFITLEPADVLEAARAADRRRASGAALGPLHGLPIPIKDSINTRDLPTTAGTPALRDFHPTEDAPIVRSLVEGGAIVLGKTNLHELSFGWTSNNLAFGPVRNPCDPTCIAGGSSGGTAAAVAARMAPLGVSEDTEGSIRVPAAFCGILGFRPTTGRYPSTGVVPISRLFDQVGPHARTVADLVLFDAVATGRTAATAPVALKGVRLAVARGYFFADLHPEIERLADDALGLLREAGAEIVDAELPDLERLIALTTSPVQYHDAYVELRAYLERYQAGVTIDHLVAAASADIRDAFERFVVPGAPRGISEAAYRAARDVHLPRLREIFRACFAATGASALVFPATMVPALPIGQETEVLVGGKALSFEAAVSRNIAPGSTAGLPGLVLPVGLTGGGLPVALEFDGPAGHDEALLALGLGVERTLGRMPVPRVSLAS